jgi:hypothetical protein
LLAACDARDPATHGDSTAASVATPTTPSTPPNFSSYDAAIAWVRSTPTLTCTSAETSRSSWIYAAEYCTDGSGTGYAIFSLKGREYIHEGVPQDVWDDFEAAPSLGRYYDENIRGRYRLTLSSR